MAGDSALVHHRGDLVIDLTPISESVHFYAQVRITRAETVLLYMRPIVAPFHSELDAAAFGRQLAWRWLRENGLQP